MTGLIIVPLPTGAEHNVRFVPIADIHWAKDAKFASARIKLAQTGASEGTKRATRALIFIGLGFQ